MEEEVLLCQDMLEDFQILSERFKDLLKEVEGNEQAEDLISDVITDTHNILKKFAIERHINEVALEKVKNEKQDLKRKLVKLDLHSKNLRTAAANFSSILKS